MELLYLRAFLVAVLIVTLLLIGGNFNHNSALAVKQPYDAITLKDPKLKLKVVMKGLKNPTDMAFLNPNDMLVLQDNKWNDASKTPA